MVKSFFYIIFSIIFGIVSILIIIWIIKQESEKNKYIQEEQAILSEERRNEERVLEKNSKAITKEEKLEKEKIDETLLDIDNMIDSLEETELVE